MTDDASPVSSARPAVSGRVRSAFLRVAATAITENRSTARRDYQGQIDYFGVYCAATSGVYLLPIESAPAKAVIALRVDLRVDPPRNNQKRRIRYAAEYRIATVRLAA